MRKHKARSLAAVLAVAIGLMMAIPAFSATGNGSIKLTSLTANEALHQTVPVSWVWRSGTYVKSTSLVNVQISPNGFSWITIGKNVKITAGNVNWVTDSATVHWPDAPYAVRVVVITTVPINSMVSPVFVDNTAPEVEITNPKQGAVIVDDAATPYPNVIAGAATLKSKASDNFTGVSKVEWFLDGTDATNKIGEGLQYTYNFGSAPGQHTIYAIATDAAGNTSQDSIGIVALPGPSTVTSGQVPGVPSPDPGTVTSLVPTPDPSTLPSPDPSTVTGLLPTPDPSQLPVDPNNPPVDPNNPPAVPSPIPSVPPVP